MHEYDKKAIKTALKFSGKKLNPEKLKKITQEIKTNRSIFVSEDGGRCSRHYVYIDDKLSLAKYDKSNGMILEFLSQEGSYYTLDSALKKKIVVKAPLDVNYIMRKPPVVRCIKAVIFSRKEEGYDFKSTYNFKGKALSVNFSKYDTPFREIKRVVRFTNRKLKKIPENKFLLIDSDFNGESIALIVKAAMMGPGKEEEVAKWYKKTFYGQRPNPVIVERADKALNRNLALVQALSKVF